MKKRSYLSGLILALFIAFIMISAALKPDEPQSKDMPDEVFTVIKNRCIGCHNTESRNDKAKEKLEFDRLDSLSVIERIGKFKDIEKELSEDKMPPKKFLERFPDKALTGDEKNILLDWAGKEKKNIN